MDSEGISKWRLEEGEMSELEMSEAAVVALIIVATAVGAGTGA
jgi:hypothetical protein